ncbi:hypothetical protein IJI94_01890 [Candidatus Saccharibacteria bacterium]|nr:hypothetical protein [Candidatus Saccharibacteria bacterium]
MDKLAKNLVKLAKITACSWAFFFIAVILTLMSKGHSFQSIAMILVIISSIVGISLTSATLFCCIISKEEQQKAKRSTKEHGEDKARHEKFEEEKLNRFLKEREATIEQYRLEIQDITNRELITQCNSEPTCYRCHYEKECQIFKHEYRNSPDTLFYFMPILDTAWLNSEVQIPTPKLENRGEEQ